MSSNETARRVFFATNVRPFMCYFCGEKIKHPRKSFWGDPEQPIETRLTIHHKDGNPYHNVPSNIVSTHFGCHTGHHHGNKVYGAITRNKISDGAKGHKRWLGRKHSTATREQMSMSQSLAAPKRKRDKRGRWA